MSLKYDNLRFYWAVLTEKKRLNSVLQRNHTFPLGF